MSVSRISRAAKAAVKTRLAHSTTGFNALLNLSLADAGIALPKGWTLPIDFDSANGRNFALADVLPDEIDGSSASTYPFMTLFGIASVNQNWQKFQLFSGAITLGINLFLSWKSAKVLPDFETAIDCCEEALFATFNAPGVAAWAIGQGGLVYNGEINLKRSALKYGGENWVQTLACVLTLEAAIQG